MESADSDSDELESVLRTMGSVVLSADEDPDDDDTDTEER
jgi:hypothetical protein